MVFFLQIANLIFNQQIESITTGITNNTISFVDLGKMVLLTAINFFVIKQAPNIAAGLAGGVASGTASLMGAARTMAGVGVGIGATGKFGSSIAKGGSSTAKWAWNKGIPAAGNAALHIAAAGYNAKTTVPRALRAINNSPKRASSAVSQSVSNRVDRVKNAWTRANANVTGNSGNSISKNS